MRKSFLKDNNSFDPVVLYYIKCHIVSYLVYMIDQISTTIPPHISSEEKFTII